MTWECLECGAVNPPANPCCGSFACQQARLAIYAKGAQAGAQRDRNGIAKGAQADRNGIAPADVAQGLVLRSKPQAPKKVQEEHPDFARFWEVYPRRKDRTRAAQAFAQAVRKGIATAAIIDGAVRYASEVAHKDAQYRLLPSTFINGRRWEDEPDASAPVKPSDPRWDMPAVGTPEYDEWREAEERRAMA